jgi:hypothetical protein
MVLRNLSFPGKMWFVDNKDDIDTMQMGEIYPSAYNNESATLQYHQQRSGINEAESWECLKWGLRVPLHRSGENSRRK